jgi:hypothetical protein
VAGPRAFFRAVGYWAPACRVGKGAKRRAHHVLSSSRDGGHASLCPPYSSRHTSVPSRHDLPEACERHPGKIGGRRECRMLSRTRGLVCNKESTRVRNHRSAEINRHSLRDGLPAYSVLSPVSGLCSHRCRQISACRARRADIAICQLDTSVGVSGPHAFAVRVRIARPAIPTRPSHPAPTFVTIAIRPSARAGRGNQCI